ncbi:hypothetical protein [Dyella sp.]|uniref:hypothetical protein n=1 Tax=Dyella sp. TaxID=1869338 RepID=UPI003F7D8E5F
MFEKINRDSVSRFVKRNATTAIVVGSVVGQAAFAQTADAMDVATPLAYIAAAVVAKNLIGPAWTGLKYLAKVWNKV